MQSWKKPTNKMVDKALDSVKKVTARKYFFLDWKIRCGSNLLLNETVLNTLPKPNDLMMAPLYTHTGKKLNISKTCVVRCPMKLSIW